MSSLGHIWGDRDTQQRPASIALATGRLGEWKPHIAPDRYRGVWVARLRGQSGFGTTPRRAYDDLMHEIASHRNQFQNGW